MDAPKNISTHVSRRNQLMQQMREHSQASIGIVFTAPEYARNADNDYPFRYDSHFYYLTGFTEPQAVLVLLAHENKSILFCRDKNMEREIWDGYRWGPGAAKEAFCFDACHSIEQLDTQLPVLMANQTIAFIQTAQVQAYTHVLKSIETLKTQVRLGNVPPTQLHDITMLVSEQRLIKDETELATMQEAANISAQAHLNAMKMCRVGQKEYHIEAQLLHDFRSKGAQSVAYTSIVATGENSCILHYRAGNATLNNGDVILIDAGCELDGYASDITRTFPVNGRFSSAQKDIYEIVLAAQNACFQELAPGKPFNAYHDAATRVLSQGMIDLGLLKGSLDSVLETQSYQQFYMHRAGHWLGLDVHDCGDYRQPNTRGPNRAWRDLQAGMVLTVEPGLYVRPADNVDPKFWGIGVRIEDDAVITPTGYTLTTRNVPVSIREIEDLMNP